MEPPGPPMEPPAPHSGGYLLKIRSGAPAYLLWLISKPYLEVPVIFLIVVKIWEPTVPPHGAPMEPLQGATFEKSPPAPLLTYCGMYVIIIITP